MKTDSEILDFLELRKDLTITFSIDLKNSGWGIISEIRPEFGAWYMSHNLREALSDFIESRGIAPSAPSYQKLIPYTKKQKDLLDHYWPK